MTDDTVFPKTFAALERLREHIEATKAERDRFRSALVALYRVDAAAVARACDDADPSGRLFDEVLREALA